jgi:hypothetical protein
MWGRGEEEEEFFKHYKNDLKRQRERESHGREREL